MRRVTLSKKSIVITAISLLVLLAAGCLLWRMHVRMPAETPGDPYVSTCSTYTGTYDFYGADSIKDVADEYSKAIVIATVEDPKALGESVHSDDPAPRITITRVLKGEDELHKGNTIPICSGLGYIDLPGGEHPAVLVFLDGKDNDVWVPSLGSLGIVPADRQGRFDLSAITENPETVTADELKQIIK
jgi:hypothetical protein